MWERILKPKWKRLKISLTRAALTIILDLPEKLIFSSHYQTQKKAVSSICHSGIENIFDSNDGGCSLWRQKALKSFLRETDCSLHRLIDCIFYNYYPRFQFFAYYWNPNFLKTIPGLEKNFLESRFLIFYTLLRIHLILSDKNVIEYKNYFFKTKFTKKGLFKRTQNQSRLKIHKNVRIREIKPILGSQRPPVSVTNISPRWGWS